MSPVLTPDPARHFTTDEQWHSALPMLAKPIKRVFWPKPPGGPMAIDIAGERFKIDEYGEVAKLP